MASVREETARGIKWGLIQKCTMQPVQFLFGIILARLISPDEMGILGLTAIFFAFAGQLQQCGFGIALIRKQERTEEDTCTVFWFNVGMSFVLSLVLFLSAPWFVSFFRQPALLNLTRVSAVLMFLNATGSVHWTLYQARRDFKTPAIVSMCTTLVAMPFTIWAAFVGWSYWAVMLQGIISGALGLITIWIISPWKPKFKFSKQSFHEFFKYGINLTMSGLLLTAYQHIRTFIIGKFYSPAQLAYFSRGEHTCSMPLSLFESTLGPVTFPILATLQNNPERLKHVYRQYIRVTAIIVEWGMITLAANSHSVILFLYGASWQPAAIYAQILCLGWMFNPLLGLNLNILAVLGRTDLSLKFEIILRTFSISAMLIAAMFSVQALCWAAVATASFALVFSCFLVTRISSVTFPDLILSFFPYLLLSLLVNIPAFIINLQSWAPIVQMMLGGSISIGLYILILWKKQDPTAILIWSLIREKLQRKGYQKNSPVS